ncbi:MAG: uracil-DNA glycosylase [Elusimicrobia bacterium]|nr:uracil-DNA glycosylase [Elusimicrobiota bacterium]
MASTAAAPAPRAQASVGAPAAASAEAPAAGGTLDALKEQVSACRKCPLGTQRLNAVFGVGSPSADVMFVGEGPGYQEDRQGEPFVGKAGQLLDDILKAIGLSRQTVYIANVVKCHPMTDPTNPEARGNDRPPTPEEIDECRPYLEEQIRLIKPRFVVTLGNVATRALLREEIGITRARGIWRELVVPGLERPVRLLPTFHPAALLRDPSLKRDVWTDMKNLRQELAS